MSPFAVLLALASTLRPTALAAVYALLVSAPPRRLQLAYIVAGALVSVGIGVLLVSLLHHSVATSRKGHPVVELVLGLGALAGALLVARRLRDPGRESADRSGRIAARLHDPSVVAAAVAGILTHFPGLFYLAASPPSRRLASACKCWLSVIDPVECSSHEADDHFDRERPADAARTPAGVVPGVSSTLRLGELDRGRRPFWHNREGEHGPSSKIMITRLKPMTASTVTPVEHSSLLIR